jgi:glycosyltransferase involved in cell wall biosynthesis
MSPMTDAAGALSGRRILVLSHRDIRHRQAGATERYLYEVTRRWVRDGIAVTWAATRPPELPTAEHIDGVEVLRAGDSLDMYPRTLIRLLRGGLHFDAVVDATSRLTVAAPLITGRPAPVVHLAGRVPPPVAASVWNRLLAGPLATRGNGDRAVVALSPSARHELRRHVGFRGPIFIAPAGAPSVTGSGLRAEAPTVLVEAALVPDSRVDLILDVVAEVAARRPALRVEIIGDGPERLRLERVKHDSGLAAIVTLRGRVTDRERDEALARAWLTVSVDRAEVNGEAVVRAAAYGRPCLALVAPGAHDFIRQGRNGDVVSDPTRLADALLGQLTLLADPDRAQRVAHLCRRWSEHFSWDRTARLVAGVVAHQIGGHGHGRRTARPDTATVVTLPAGVTAPAGLRVTDEIRAADGGVSLLLGGCDEHDAHGVLARLGLEAADIRLADHDDLLIGPRPAPVAPQRTPTARRAGHLTAGRRTPAAATPRVSTRTKG